MSLTLYAFVGMIMLIGIVKKNAIMMIDFALEKMRSDPTVTPADAVYQAATPGSTSRSRASDEERFYRKRSSKRRKAIAPSRNRPRRNGRPAGTAAAKPVPR